MKPSRAAKTSPTPTKRREPAGSASQPADPATETGRWLLLIHQIPPTPNYLRVKIGRRLARIGAVALKSTVYVLPRSDSSQEDFAWVRREVVEAGGEAFLLTAQLLDGLTDRDVEALFNRARDADYTAIADDARELVKRIDERDSSEDRRRQFETEIVRLERRMEETMNLDYFDAASREPARGLVASLRRAVTPADHHAGKAPGSQGVEFRDRTWVTRTGIKVDRIGSAWLIRRFIDPGATFRFVPAKGYEPEAGELRFDMFEAEFTHEGDLCTFEVLCSRFGLDAPGLAAVAELVHDVDLKDGKFGRPESAGLAAQIDGLTSLHHDDESRLDRGSDVFEGLLAHFAKARR